MKLKLKARLNRSDEGSKRRKDGMPCTFGGIQATGLQMEAFLNLGLARAVLCSGRTKTFLGAYPYR